MKNSFQLGNKLKQEGNLEEAVTSYQQAIQTNPKFYWSYQNLGEVFLKLGRWDEAVNNYRKAIDLNPKSAWSHYYLGEALINLGQWEEAVVAYRRVIEIDPNSDQFHNKLGETLYEISLKINRESLQTYIRLTELLFQSENRKGYATELCYLNDKVFLQATEELNDRDFIEEVYRTYLRREGDEDGKNHYCRELANGMSRGEIISGFRSSQEFKNKLLESFREINLHYLSEDMFIKATEELNNEKFVEQTYRTYLKREPDTGGKNLYLKHINDGMSRYEIIDMFDKSPEFDSRLIGSVRSIYLERAILSYRTAISLEPNFHKSHQNLGDALNQLGNNLKQEGKLDKAIDIYKEAIAISSNWDEVYYNQGIALSQQGLLDEAIDSYKQAIAINPNWPEAHFNLGNALVHQGKLDRAIESYRTAIALLPNWGGAHLTLGNTLLQANKPQEAIKSYKQALALEPNWAGIPFGIGNALLQENNAEEAIKSYKQALALEPNWAQVHLTLGHTLALENRLEEAIESYERAIALNPNDINMYNLVGSHLYICSGLPSKATNYWLRALDVQRDQAEKYGLIGKGIRYLTEVWSSRIGHLGLLNYYAKMEILGWLPQKTTILFAPPDIVANSYLLNYFHPYFQIISEPSLITDLYSEAVYLEDYLYTMSIGNQTPELWWYAGASAQKQWEVEGRSPLLTLPDSDKERGWGCLRELGVPKGAWFVCLHVRESGFHKEVIDFDIRNTDLDTYLLAVNSVVSRGGWVIRMGDPTMKSLSPMDGVIDYAHSRYKNDWMDVFLCAQCRFFIGTNSGLFLVPSSFGVPCIWTNWIPVETRPWESQGIFIPKLYWSEKENRYMTFAEQMSPPLNASRSWNFLSKLGIKIIDNTPEELRDIVVEILDRLDSTLKYTEEDERLQSCFNTLAEYHRIPGTGRIGKDFLRKYADLLNPLNLVLAEQHNQEKSTQSVRQMPRLYAEY